MAVDPVLLERLRALQNARAQGLLARLLGRST